MRLRPNQSSPELDEDLLSIIQQFQGYKQYVKDQLIRAVSETNDSIAIIKDQGLTMLNSTRIVSELMKNLAIVKTVKGTDKKILILQILNSLVEDSPDAELIRATVPNMIDNFHGLLQKKKGFISNIVKLLKSPFRRCF